MSKLNIIATITLVSVLPFQSSIASNTSSKHLKPNASYYAGKFQDRKTASGERFNTHALTAAHKTLPFNTRVKVTNVANKKSVVVRINDKGPYVKGRIIDLSKKASDTIKCGLCHVSLKVVAKPTKPFHYPNTQKQINAVKPVKHKDIKHGK